MPYPEYGTHMIITGAAISGLFTLIVLVAAIVVHWRDRAGKRFSLDIDVPRESGGTFDKDREVLAK